MPEITAEEVKKAIDDMGASNHARLNTFQTQIEEIKKNGTVAAETKERLDKIVKDMAEFESIKAMPERLKLIEASLKRAGYNKDGQKELPADAEEAKTSCEGWMRRGENITSTNEWKYEKHSPRAGVKSLSVVSDPDGGYMVRHDLNGRIVKQVFETSDMRAICSVQSISTDALEGLYDDNTGVSGGWVGEREARSETNTSQIGKWVIPVHEQYAYPFTTQKNLDDSSWDVEGWLAGKIADIMVRTENTAFVLGAAGAKKPRGFIDYASGTTLRTQIERVKSGASGDVTYAGLVNIMMALKGQYRARARWGMARTTIAKVMGLVDLYGRPLWVPQMTQGAPSMLLGLPISELNDLAAPTSASLSIAIADWQEAYQIVDRAGVRILRNPFATLGYVGYYTTKRTGGDVVNTEAIKIGYLSA